MPSGSKGTAWRRAAPVDCTIKGTQCIKAVNFGPKETRTTHSPLFLCPPPPPPPHSKSPFLSCQMSLFSPHPTPPPLPNPLPSPWLLPWNKFPRWHPLACISYTRGRQPPVSKENDWFMEMFVCGMENLGIICVLNGVREGLLSHGAGVADRIHCRRKRWSLRTTV